MITESLIDPSISSRLCLMLLHSLWQVTLLATVAWSAGRVWRRSLNRVYVWHVLALAAGLAAMPVTYLLVEAPAAKQQTTAAGPVVPSEPVAEPGEPSLGMFQDAAPAPTPVAPTVGPITEPVFPSAVSSTDSSTVATSESTDSSQPWFALAPWVALVYVAGVVLMFGRLSISLWSARRLVGRAQPITDGPLLERFQTLARRCSVPIRPALARARQIAVPKAVGLLKPTILLPAAALAGLTPEQLEMILIHELTHLRRHDLWINLLQRVAEVLLFFNPALWWLSRRISTLREYGCDEMTCRTLATTDQEPRLRYAMALLQIARLSQETMMPRHHHRPEPSELATLAAAGRSPSELRRRVAHLFGEPIHEPLRISRGGLVTLLAVALAVILSSSLWPVIAQTDKTDAQADQREASENRVEVIAIGTHNEEPQRWWDTSGKIIESPPFDWKEGHDVSGDDRPWRRIVIRVHDLAAGEEVRWEISGRPDSWGATVTVDGKKNPRGYYTRHFVVPEGQHDLRLRVGIASGEWKTIARLGTHDTISLDRGEPSFISAGTFQQNGGTTVFLTHDVFEHNFRVIAVDKAGRTHDSGTRGGTSRGETIYQSRVTFSGLSRDEIDHFEFQARPYKWNEIAGLPLRPQTGDTNPAKATAETNPQDAQALDSTAVKLADGTTVRLVGVANNKDRIEREEAKKQGKSYRRVFWKPDGTKLPEPPYVKPSVFSNERTAYEFAFQISGTEDFGCTGGEGYWTGNACTEDRKRIPNLCVAVSRTITADAPQADVTIGIASGKWQTVESWKGFQWERGVAGSSVIRNEKGIMLSWPTQQEDAVEVTLAHKYVQEQTRLVAFNAGKVVEAKQSGLGSGEGIVGAVYTFPDLALDDDFELAFQSRPYTWMTFRNISVRPGHRTNPQVSLDGQNGDDNDGLPLHSRNAEDALGRNEPPGDEDQNYEFPISISGRTIDQDGQPIVGAEIVLVSRAPGYRRLAETKSDQQGRYRFEEVPFPIKRADTVNGEDVGAFEIFGLAEGYALAWKPQKWFYPDSPHEDDSNLDFIPPLDLPTKFGRDDPISLDLTFRPPKRLRGRIVDDQGQPIPNTKLALRYCDPWWDQENYSRISHAGSLDSLNSSNIVPPRVKLRTTDEDGRFEFTGLPADYRWRIDVRPPGHPPKTIWAVTRAGVDSDAKGNRVYSGDFEVVFPRTRRMQFLVVDEDSAEPLAKVGVGGRVSEIGFWKTTDEGGLIETNLPDGEYTITMFPRFGTPYWRTDSEIVVSEETAQQINVLRLRRAAVVDVTVTDSVTGEPLSGVDIWLEEQFPNSDTALRDVHGYRSWEVETRLSRYESPRTNEDGKMRVLFEPGEHRIGIGREAYPRGYAPVEPDGKEVVCQVGEITNIEFLMRKDTSTDREAR